MKKVLITGGSDGLGKEVVSLLIERGISVVCLSRSECMLGAEHIYLDLCDNESIGVACDQLQEEHADADVLINCAGVFQQDLLGSMDFDLADQTFNANISGLIKLTSMLFSTLESNEADIVNVGSTISFKAYPSQAVYGASKWAVRGFTEYLQTECKGKPVRIIGFYPGGFRSRLHEKATGKEVDLSPFMDPKDLAKFLVSILELPKSMEVSSIIVNRKSLQ